MDFASTQMPQSYMGQPGPSEQIEQLRCNLTDLEGRFRRLRRLA